MTTHVRRTPTFGAVTLGAVTLAALGPSARPAAAQATYFPDDATINYTVPAEAFVGITTSNVVTSPTVNLVSPGLVDSDMQVYGGTLNVTGGSVSDILEAFNSSAINLSGGAVGTDLEADGSSTVIVSGGQVGSPGRVDFFDNLLQTGGAFTFVGTGLSYAPDPGGPTFGPGTDYTLSGRLQSGRSVAGDIIDVADGATMFTLLAAPEPPAFAGLALGALGLGALVLKARKRA